MRKPKTTTQFGSQIELGEKLPGIVGAERGSGTVMAITLIAGIFAAGLLIIALAVTFQARWQAQLAADFGALAGASAWRAGLVPCEYANYAVSRNSAVLANQCQSVELLPDSRVKVTTAFEFNLLGRRRALATAIAGPGLPP